MRKYIVILLIAASSVCCAQNSIKIFVNLNKIETRFNGKFKIAKRPTQTIFVIRQRNIQLYEEVLIKIDENIYLKPAVGCDYEFSASHFSPLYRLDLVGDFDKFLFRVAYGSSLAGGVVSTKCEYKFTDNFFAGLQTSNNLIGPRVDYRFKALCDKNFSIGCYYLSKDKYGVSFRFDIFEFFPKWKEKRDKMDAWLNDQID
jgi:hypothetical protein